MKRKLLIAFLSALAMFSTLFTVVACADDKTPEHTHAGGTATCITLAVCDECGLSYGELNPANHESTEFTYVANNDGTHRKKNKCCGAVVSEAETCAGGTATCVKKAVCATCGGEFGEVDSANHASETYTYASIGNGKHQKKHDCCETLFGEEEACAGGTATCVKKAVCATCGGEYGEVDSDNHASDVINHTANGNGTHKAEHACCGAYTDETCAGGTATCVKKAVCATCGGEYGELDSANHASAEFVFVANNDGTHQKKNKCCGAAVGEAENCAGGTATCVKKAVCATCGGEYGEVDSDNHASEEVSLVPGSDNGDGTHKMKHDCCGAEYSVAHGYDAGYNYDEPSVDRKVCECGAISSDGFNKTAPRNQKLVMTNDVIALDLDGVSAYDSVQSITLNGTDLGTDIAALNMSAFKGDDDTVKKLHGENTVKVVVKEGDYTHEITVSVILVTKEIATEADLKEALRFGQDEGSVFGYYELKNDIVYTGSQNKAHFRGIFDGNGKTVTVANIANGLFSYLYPGAVIENLTIKATITQNSANKYMAVLAASIYDDKTDKRPVTVDNLTIIYAGGTDSSDIFGGGFITRGTANNVNFKNLTVRAAGKKIGSLLGTSVSGVTFENSVVIADEFNCLAASADGTQRVEYDGVDGLTVITGSQEIPVASAAPALDLKGLDNGRTVTGITVGEYSLGSDVNALVIPDEFKNDKQSHGKKAVTVTFTDGSEIDLSVTFVTGTISTANEFIEAVTIKNGDASTTVKYGYYKLAKDIAFTSNVNGYASSGQDANEASSEYGFRGTVDGCGYTISTSGAAKVYNGGFFGLLGKGALVKNVKFDVALYSGIVGLFGAEGHGAMIESVEITLNSNSSVPSIGFLFVYFSGSMSYKNVSVNAEGLDLTTIFGVKCGYNVAPACNNVNVYAKSLSAIYRKGYGGDNVTVLEGFYFTEKTTD